jgi:hypothetical protein
MTTVTETTPISDEAEDDISLLDLLQTVVDNLRLLVLGPLVVGCLGHQLCHCPHLHRHRQVFAAPATAKRGRQHAGQPGWLGGLAGAAAGLKNPADQYLAFMKSNSVQDALIERFNCKSATKPNSKPTPAWR